MKRAFLYRDDLSVTKAYIIAVVIIAVLATGAFVALHSALNDSKNTALVVNLSGKQRMLSQKIGLEVHRLFYFQAVGRDKAYLKSLESLQSAAQEMALANKKLSSGKLSMGKFTPPSSAILELYFGEMNIYQRVYKYTELVNNIDKNITTEDLLMVVDKLNAISGPLLHDLNKVVFQYQVEGESRLVFLQRMETAIWLLTLLALILEVIFIFRPMANRVRKVKEIEQNFVVQLRDQVELRTLKLEQANQKLLQAASHDPLTGIKNRLTFEADIEKLHEAFSKHKQHFALVIVDLDWFKKVNDRFGHDYGDYVLKTFAELLQSSIRKSDEVYRVGGEEFVILFTRINFPELLTKLNELKASVSRYDYSLNGKNHKITASFGVYHSSLFTIEAYRQAFKSADKALYEAKHFGRNRINIAKKEEIKTAPPKTYREVHLRYADLTFQQLLKVDGNINDLLGFSASQLLNSNCALPELVYSPDYDLIETMQRDLEQNSIACKSIRLKTQNDQIIIARVKMTKQDKQVDVVIQNVTDLAENIDEETLLYSFYAMMENTNDFIYFKDRNHVFTAASKSLVELTSVDSNENLIGKVDYEVFPKPFADEYFLLEKEVLNGNVSVSQKFQPYEDNEGNKGWVDNRKYPIKNANEEIIGLFGIARIVSTEEYRHAIEETQLI